MNKRYIILSIAFVFLFAAACGPGSDLDLQTEMTIDVSRYANMNGTWQYQVTLANGEIKQIANKVIGPSNKFGYNVHLLRQLDANDHILGTYYINQDMTDGFYIVGADVGGLGEYKYHPPVAYLFRTFVPGKSYIFSYSASDPGSVVTGILTITRETVVVPAGTFTDCYKSTFKVSTGGELVTDEYWWAKDVGQVKHVEPTGDISELVTHIP